MASGSEIAVDRSRGEGDGHADFQPLHQTGVGHSFGSFWARGTSRTLYSKMWLLPFWNAPAIADSRLTFRATRSWQGIKPVEHPIFPRGGFIILPE